MRPFIERYLEDVNNRLGDPSTSRRVTTAYKLELLDAVQKDVWEKLLRATGSESLVGYTETPISLTADQDFYPLPGNFRQFLSLESRTDADDPDTATGKLNSIPLYHPGPGVQILSEQRGMRIKPVPTSSSDTWVLTYLKGPITLHYGDAQGVPTATQIQLAASVASDGTEGELVTSDDYYNGSLIHIYSADTGARQVREIEDYDAGTKTVTVRAPFSPAPSGSVKYEIVPDLPYGYDDVYAIFAAFRLTPARGNQAKRLLLKDELIEALTKAKSYIGSNVADRPGEKIIKPNYDDVDPYEAGY
jgi:hypothetical protein